jgi:vacuolar protein sorting-associated protein 13A/C
MLLSKSSNEFNAEIFEQLNSDSLHDIQRQYTLSQSPKMFIEQFTIHPMRLTLSFYPTRYPRSTRAIPPSMRWMRRIENVTAVEDFEVKINSYIAQNVMESLPRLMDSVGAKIAKDLQGNLIKIARNLIGSLSILGKPAGLYKNIGSGVQDFFYEVILLILLI